MNRLISPCLYVVFLTLGANLFAQERSLDLIPKPQKLQFNEGELRLDQPFSLFYDGDFDTVATLMQSIPDISLSSVEPRKKMRKRQQGRVILVRKPNEGIVIPAQGFQLRIDSSAIVIDAHRAEAAIQAVHTLHQIRLLQGDVAQLPALRMEDEPRFMYRGLHLDVSRHFMPIEFVKKYIDLMALYRFNVFHWHLTDGAGWRLEIKRYPELTSKAAWRSHAHFADWQQYGKQYLEYGAANAHGGFYTQEQAREVVQYAASKGITVIPEIEVPGHSEEVLAVYPQLSCAEAPYQQNEFCIGNEQTFEFLKHVFDEVLDIFPSKLIHIGGDEADKTHWKSCAKCQALIKGKSLGDEAGLQSYAIQQVSEYLQAKGRQVIGWDEIIEGGLAKDAVVMSWRGEEGGVEAANLGHQVIMTPQTHLYFDFYQSDPRTQPKAFGGYLPLSKVYSYEPIPAGVDQSKAKHIMGAQANLWTEFMPTPQQVEYMAFPRAIALAEVNWTAKENRSFDDFYARLQSHYSILQKLNVNYYRPPFAVGHTVDYNPSQRKNTVALTSEIPNPTIYYTLDGSEPTTRSTRYVLPFDLSASATVKAAYFIDSTRVGPVATIATDIHKAIGRRVTYQNAWNSSYPAQKEVTLLDGKKGGISYQDGAWQGFTSDINVTIDMDRREEIQKVSATFMQMPGPGVYYPSSFKVLVSDNGKKFREVGVDRVSEHVSGEELEFKTFEVALDKPLMAKYIQVIAENGHRGFLFVDEIVVD